MLKYYTRACNFIYGNLAKKKIKSGQALPLCGNNLIAFSSVEIFIRNKILTPKFNIIKQNIKSDPNNIFKFVKC